jgi:hypothetical protein
MGDVAPVAIRDELKAFKKERILETAERPFDGRGLRATRLDAIAESLDITKPFIDGVCERKVDILVDIDRRAVNRSLEAIRSVPQEGGAPSRQLHRFALQFTEAVIANQPGVAAFFREEAPVPPQSARRIDDLKGRFDDERAALIGEGVAAGEFRVEDRPPRRSRSAQ